VNVWVRELYEKKIGSRKPATAERATGVPLPQAARKQVIEFRNPEYPWPDKPEIPERIIEDPFDADDVDDDDFSEDSWEPPSEEDTNDENNLMLRQQAKFRWAAQWIAIAMSKLPEVHKVAAFGPWPSR